MIKLSACLMAGFCIGVLATGLFLASVTVSWHSTLFNGYLVRVSPAGLSVAVRP